MKKRKRIVGILIVFGLITISAMAGTFGRRLYINYRENVEIEKLLKENTKASEAFDKADKRNEKLQILRKFKKDYVAYMTKSNSREVVKEDYENRISEMKKYFTESYMEVIENCTIKEATTREEVGEYLKELEQLLVYVKQEKEVVLDGSDSFQGVVEHLQSSCLDKQGGLQWEKEEKEENASKDTSLIYAKAAQEAVQAYQEANQNIKDEEEFYTKYIGFIKNGLKDEFQTINPADLDFSCGNWGDNFFDIYGYSITDLDGNGVKELLIGGSNEEGYCVIEDIYTVHDGKMVQIAGGWERNRYFLCENGAIANEGSGGAGYCTYVYSEYKKGCLEFIETVIYDYERNPENPYFYGDRESAMNFENLVGISEEKAEEIKAKYAYRVIPYTPFFEENSSGS